MSGSSAFGGFRCGFCLASLLTLTPSARLSCSLLCFYQIIAGQLLLVHEDKVYKVNAWINSHPGGEQLMLHFIGRDVSRP